LIFIPKELLGRKTHKSSSSFQSWVWRIWAGHRWGSGGWLYALPGLLCCVVSFLQRISAGVAFIDQEGSVGAYLTSLPRTPSKPPAPSPALETLELTTHSGRRVYFPLPTLPQKWVPLLSSNLTIRLDLPLVGRPLPVSSHQPSLTMCMARQVSMGHRRAPLGSFDHRFYTLRCI